MRTPHGLFERWMELLVRERMSDKDGLAALVAEERAAERERAAKIVLDSFLDMEPAQAIAAAIRARSGAGGEEVGDG